MELHPRRIRFVEGKQPLLDLCWTRLCYAAAVGNHRLRYALAIAVVAAACGGEPQEPGTLTDPSDGEAAASVSTSGQPNSNLPEPGCAPPPEMVDGGRGEASGCGILPESPPEGSAGGVPACSLAPVNIWGLPSCREHSDCLGAVCRTDAPNVSECVNAPATLRRCDSDADCALGTVCAADYLSTHPCQKSVDTSCLAACTAESCPAGQRCRQDGHCETFHCSDGYTCPEGWNCLAESSGRLPDANGCVYSICDTDGYQCPAGSRCDTENGFTNHGCVVYDCVNESPCPPNHTCDSTGTRCERKSCTRDVECDCGACFDGECVDNEPFCLAPI